MKKKSIASLFFFMSFACILFSQNEQMRFDRQSWREATGEIGSGLIAFIDWDNNMDPNEKETALLRIKVVDMSDEEARTLIVRISGGLAHIVNQSYNAQRQEIQFFVTADNPFNLSVHGRGSRSDIVPIPALTARRVYDITLQNLKKQLITIKTIPDDIEINLDGERLYDNQTTVSMGRHKITFGQWGRTIKDTIIQVGDMNYNFEFDLRKKYGVDISSEPTGARVKVFVGNTWKDYKNTPTRVYEPEGTYQMIVSKEGMSDTSWLVVSSDVSYKHVVIEKRRKVEFFATFNGKRIEADFFIRRKDGVYDPPATSINGRRNSFNLTLPYGIYEVRMSNGNKTATRDIKINDNSSIVYSFKLKQKNPFEWPWQKNFESRVSGFSIGLTQGSYSAITSDGHYVDYNPAWGNFDSRLAAFQAGIHFQPAFPWGLGLYTGLFYQYYFSFTPSSEKATSENGSLEQTYTNFSEHEVTVPLHLYFRLPFNEIIALSFHGGPDVSYAFKARYDDRDNQFLTWNPPYGEGFLHKHINLSYSIAAGFQIKWAMIEAVLQKGITNHDIDYGDGSGVTSTKKNALFFRFSFLF